MATAFRSSSVGDLIATSNGKFLRSETSWIALDYVVSLNVEQADVDGESRWAVILLTSLGFGTSPLWVRFGFYEQESDAYKVMDAIARMRL